MNTLPPLPIARFPESPFHQPGTGNPELGTSSSPSRCLHCYEKSGHCICDEDEPTDSWRPMVAGMNQWPLIVIASLLLSGCNGPALRAFANAPLWVVATTALLVGMGGLYILAWAIAKPRGSRGLGLDLDHDDESWDERGPYGYHDCDDGPDHAPLVDWEGNPRLVITRDLGREVEMPESVARKLNEQRERHEDQQRLRLMQAYVDGTPMTPVPPMHHGHEF